MMKSHSWDELNDSAKDFFDSTGLLNDSDFEEDSGDRHAQRRRLTELRRRAEERLEWKRLYGELQFDDLDSDHDEDLRDSGYGHDSFDESLDEH